MAEKTTEKSLTPKQRRGIAAMMSTGTVVAAAQAAGVSPQTFYRWRKMPHFAQALRKAERDALDDLSRTMAGLGVLASSAIRDALSPEQPIGVRLRAADLVTSRTTALQEITNIIERLEALEAKK